MGRLYVASTPATRGEVEPESVMVQEPAPEPESVMVQEPAPEPESVMVQEPAPAPKPARPAIKK